MNLVMHHPSRPELLIRILQADLPLLRNPLCRVVHAWLRTLKCPSDHEAELWRLLETRISCLNALNNLVRDGDSKRVDDGGLRHWMDGVDYAMDCFNRQDFSDLESAAEEAACEVPQLGAVLCSTAWQTLSDWIGQTPIPHAVRDAVVSCAAISRRWSERTPVPPCDGRSWDTGRYIHCHQGLDEILPALRTELENWDDLVVEDFAEEFVRQGRHSGTGAVTFNSARFSSARDLLLTACRDLLAGWPFESSRLEAATQALSATIPDAAAPLASSFGQLRSVLGLLTSAMATQRDLGRIDESVIEATAAELAPVEGFSASLISISSWVHRVGIDLIPKIRADLADLVEKARAQEPVEQTSVGRDLLGLLVDIDSQLGVSTESSRELMQLRDQLRRVLVECFPYKVLDASTLIGRTFDELRDRVRVRHTQPGSPEGRIVHVQRPGYVFQFPDGRSTVIRRAEVDISR